MALRTFRTRAGVGVDAITTGDLSSSYFVVDAVEPGGGLCKSDEPSDIACFRWVGDERTALLASQADEASQAGNSFPGC